MALPFAGAILEACARPGTLPPGVEPFKLSRPSDPATLPMNGDPIPSGRPTESGPLQLYNWSEYIYPRVVKDFSKQFGVDVEVTTFNNIDEGLAKLRTGQLHADVFVPTIDVLGKLVAADLVQPLNHDYIPNLEANVWPVYQDPFYDRHWRYSVPYTVYTTGVGYRRDHIPDDVIDGMENPYRILWDRRYSGQAGIYDDYREGICLGLMYDGVTDLNTGDDALISRATERLKTLSDTMDIRIDTNGAYSGLPQGKFTVHQAWSGDMVAAWQYKSKGTPNTAFGYWFPSTHKGPIANDLLVVPADAPHPVLAHTFLNYLLDPKVALKNFGWNGYQPPQNSADPSTLTTTKSAFGEPYVFPTMSRAVVQQEDFKEGYLELELAPHVDDRWHDAWQEFLAGAG